MFIFTAAVSGGFRKCTVGTFCLEEEGILIYESFESSGVGPERHETVLKYVGMKLN